jgi:hypothetical protein
MARSIHVPAALPASFALVVAILIATFVATPEACAQVSSTAFTYQGELENGGTGVNVPSARMVFRLWDAETAGTQVGSDFVAYPVTIADGIFTAAIDFGASAFAGNARWLEIGVDVAGGTSYTWMTPRQRVTAAPMAVYALHGGDSPWALNGTNVYYNGGRVGIGTAEPGYPLTVLGSTSYSICGITTSGSAGIYGQANGATGQGIFGRAWSSTGTTRGVAGYAESPTGCGIHGTNAATTGSAIAVYGENASPNGVAIYGKNTSGSGTPTAVMGTVSAIDGYGVYAWNSADEGNPVAVYGGTDSNTGYGGYFYGRGYFSSRLGIGVEEPTTMLDVAGTAKVTGLQLTTSPQAGYVLTADASGNGTWQAPSGGGGGIGGSGSPYYLPKFTGATTLGNSSIYEATGGNIGIGTTVPTAKLHVLGTVRMNGLQLSSTPMAGYVLTSDAAGTGTWQAPTGESYWHNSTGGIYYNAGVVGIGTTTPSTLSALDVVTTATTAISTTGGNYGVRGEGSNTGVIGAGGTRGVQGTGTSWGVQGISTGGVGVRGESTTGIGVNAISAGTGTTNPAVYASNNNSNGIAIFSTCTSLDANLVAVNKGSGDIIKGFSGPTGGNMVFRVENNGKTSVSVLQITGGADLSEQFDVQAADAEIRPGMVVCIDPNLPGRLIVSTRAYDRAVAGVISGAGGVQPGMMMGQRGSLADGSQPVALTGRVYVYADASQGAIRPGDLLTTSDIPGHAMRVADHGRAQGAILGKAMTTLSEGTGLVLVLVSLQ